MKIYIFILVFIVLVKINFGQINNGGFENWRVLPTSTSSEDPAGWTSNNPGILKHYNFASVEKSTDAHTGNLAAKLNVFYDSSGNCGYSFLSQKEIIIDTSLYSNNCYPLGTSLIDFDTLNYIPYKISFYYKTYKLINNINNYFEVNIYDTTSGGVQGFTTIQFTPTNTYQKKEILFKNILSHGVFQLIHLSVNIQNTFDSSKQGGYVLIDDLKFERRVSITELNKQTKITLFPNPSQNKVTIKAEKTMSAIIIMDIQGKEIKKYKINSTKKELDINFLNKGIYILKISTKNGVVIKKLVKK